MMGELLDEKLAIQSKKLEEKMETMLDVKLEKALAPLKLEVESLEKRVEQIERRLSETDDVTSRVCNLQLNGLPFREKENLKADFASLASILGYSDPPEVKIRRFNGTDNAKRPILIVFSTEFHKLQFLQRYKSKSADMVRSIFDGFPNDKNRIYLQHDFTNSQYKFYKSAIKLLKENAINQVVVHEGNKIVIKIDKNDKYTSFADVAALEDEIQRRKNRQAKAK